MTDTRQAKVDITTSVGKSIIEDELEAIRVRLVNVEEAARLQHETGRILPWKGSSRGEGCIIDFYTMMALEQNAFQVRAGTVTTHLTGDVDIIDTAAEMCADAALGLYLIPCHLNVHIEALGGTVPIITAKSVSGASTAGTAFVPLPLFIGGKAARASARVAAAGGVTVPAELATTTRRHYTGTVNAATVLEWLPLLPPVLMGATCFYIQVAATTTGPDYYANFEFIELTADRVA